jgi:hypothetical protein
MRKRRFDARNVLERVFLRVPSGDSAFPAMEKSRVFLYNTMIEKEDFFSAKPFAATRPMSDRENG